MLRNNIDITELMFIFIINFTVNVTNSMEHNIDSEVKPNSSPISQEISHFLRKRWFNMYSQDSSTETNPE
jgi:hypothetical protein